MKRFLKIIVYCAVLVINECCVLHERGHGNDHDHDHQHENNCNQGSQDDNFKKFKQSLTRNDMCTFSCIENVVENYSKDKYNDFVEFDLKNSGDHYQDVCSALQDPNSIDIDETCNVYRNAKQCVKACPHGKLKTLVEKWEQYKFVCEDKFDDFKKHLPCIISLCGWSIENCYPQCFTDFEGNRNGNNMHDFARKGRHIEDLAKDVSKACKQINCFMNCVNRPIAERCTEEAAKLVRDLMKHTMDAVKSVFLYLGMPSYIWPISCEKISY